RRAPRTHRRRLRARSSPARDPRATTRRTTTPRAVTALQADERRTHRTRSRARGVRLGSGVRSGARSFRSGYGACDGLEEARAATVVREQIAPKTRVGLHVEEAAACGAHGGALHVLRRAQIVRVLRELAHARTDHGRERRRRARDERIAGRAIAVRENDERVA